MIRGSYPRQLYEILSSTLGSAGDFFPAFVVGSPKGDLGHLGDLLPKRGLLKVTFLFKSLLSKRKDDRDVLHTSFAAHKAELFLR